MYALETHAVGPFPLVEASGAFTAADLWELVGERSRVSTFTLAAGSESRTVFGTTVVGVVLYHPDERTGAPATLGADRLRLQATMRDFPRELERRLQHPGLPLADITCVQFVPIDRPIEHHAEGDKKIPNVIEIPYEHDPTLNVNSLIYGYLVSKSNDGVELAPFEKAQLVGIILAQRDGKIDSRILDHFAVSIDDARNSPEIWYYRLTAKERQGKALTPHEKTHLDDLREIRRMQAVTTVLTEVKKRHLELVDASIAGPILTKVLESAIAFKPDILLHGKGQVYWDVATYAHIALGHVKGLQLGPGTTFPYRADDLKMLIEKVLGCVDVTIQEHFAAAPGKRFFLAGKRSIYFNGDYYSFHIEGNGRLVNFHSLSDRRIQRKAA